MFFKQVKSAVGEQGIRLKSLVDTGLRIAIHPVDASRKHAATPQDVAFEQIEALIAQSGACLLIPTGKHRAVIGKLADSGETLDVQFHDAWIDAICLEKGVTIVWTEDRDFTACQELFCQSPKVPVFLLNTLLAQLELVQAATTNIAL